MIQRNLWAWQFSKAETHGYGAQIRGLEGGHGQLEVKREETFGEGSQQGHDYSGPTKA